MSKMSPFVNRRRHVSVRIVSNLRKHDKECKKFEYCSKSGQFHQPGLDFLNVLRTAFTPVVPQSVRTQSSCQYLFTLLGPTSVKAVRITLMKLTHGYAKHLHVDMLWHSTSTSPTKKRPTLPLYQYI